MIGSSCGSAERSGKALDSSGFKPAKLVASGLLEGILDGWLEEKLRLTDARDGENLLGELRAMRYKACGGRQRIIRVRRGRNGLYRLLEAEGEHQIEQEIVQRRMCARWDAGMM